MTAREQLAEVARMRRDLPIKQADAVAAARSEGMTWRDIANELGITERALYKAQAASQ